MTAIKIADSILIFTANDIHKMTYVGAPYAYGVVEIASGCGPLSPRAVVRIGNVVMWPGLQTFWGYAGTVQPVKCDVDDWFFSLLNRSMVGRVFGSAQSCLQRDVVGLAGRGRAGVQQIHCGKLRRPQPALDDRGAGAHRGGSIGDDGLPRAGRV